MFSLEKQINFAEISGDCNPMHMRPLDARRTSAGAALVHGMHVVARSIDAAVQQFRPSWYAVQVSVRFVKPVYVGDTVAINILRCTDNELLLQAEVEGLVVTKMRLVTGVE